MNILGIETSCDETGVAIYDGKNNRILSETLFSQAEKHSLYGGVVPELASRDHVAKIIPLLRLAIEESGLNQIDLDGIAYTAGPGLRGPLLIGASISHALSKGWGKPCVGVNHMEGHLLMNLLESPRPSFPFLTLLISGGHCMLINTKNVGEYSLLGQTRDDAVGEAFDKVAKLLGLPYPGGPQIEKLALNGNPKAFVLPRPMTKDNHLDFSFSGLKTAVLYTLEKEKDPSEDFKQDLAASFQEAVAETLLIKSKKALESEGLNQLVVGGGVAANRFIMNKFHENLSEIDVFSPDIRNCTDNGSMIAITGYHRLKKGHSDKKIQVRPRWDLSDI
ncbi:MAG: tRNA (adenosine(37)-N6)-threonylcarbamoyltransferase complex transferase subunit TsaD [Gammaproteobacteria bacterium]